MTGHLYVLAAWWIVSFALAYASKSHKAPAYLPAIAEANGFICLWTSVLVLAVDVLIALSSESVVPSYPIS